MVIITDAERRITLPEDVKPGSAFTVEIFLNGEVLLKPCKQEESKIKFVRENGVLVAWTPHVITMEQTRALMDEFP